jgi:hypothetical protein
MKTLSIILLGLVLCGSLFASELAESQAGFASALAKPTPYQLVDKAKGTERFLTLSGVDYIKLIAGEDRWSSAARQALARDKSAQGLVSQLKSWRKVVAKIEATEAKTFLGRTLDPALAALDSLEKNPAGRTQAHVDALNRLASALTLAK